MRRLLAGFALAVAAVAAHAQMNGGVMESQKQGAAAITSGAINGATIGATTPSSGAFTTLSASSTFTASGNGPHALGGSTSSSTQLHLTGTYTPSASDSFGVLLDSTQNPGIGNNGIMFYVAGTLNRQGSGTHTEMAGLYVQAPNIGAGAAAITNATTLKIPSAPTAGTNQRALWVAGGLTQLDGALTVTPFNASVTLSPTGNGVVTVNPATAGTLNNVSIGQSTPLAGSFTTLTSSSAPVLTGSSTNDSAAAGKIGELLTGTLAAGSQITLTTATGANVITLSVTAGDWDCAGQVTHNAAATTSITLLQIGISASTATLPTQAGGSGIGTDPLAIYRVAASVPAGALTTNVGPVRVSLSGTTNIFLVVNDTFTVAGMQAYGTLRCRRAR